MARLTYKQRKKMKKSSFALPEKKGKGKAGGVAGKGAYPIPDIAHARNALARVAAYGTPEEKARVRAAVYRKFPSLAKRKAEREGRAAAFARGLRK
jgi:hypothetical protein